MSYTERNTWVQGIATVVLLAIYLPITLANPDGDWLIRMLWAIGAGVMMTIIGQIVWNLAAGIRRGVGTQPDERDLHISHIADRIGQACVVIAVIIAIVMCAGAASPFWIAHVLFLGMAASALAGCAAALIMYRVGTM